MDRYIVAPREPGNIAQQRMLLELAKHVEQIPGASVGLPQGPAAPRRLTIEVDLQTAKDLESRFGHGLIIEVDAPLNY